MGLKWRTRRWLDAVSTASLDELRGNVERLAGEVGTLLSRGEDQERHQQRVTAMLRDDLAALADRFEARSDQNYATADALVELEHRIDGKDAKVEEVRLALAGLTDQLRWESDDLRRGLAAIIERVERQRKPA